jgi:HPt (histidine-containing phosphotransfer) domain-containing protein
MEAIQTLRELTPDEPGFLKELLTLFLQNAPKQIQSMRSALQAADLKQIAREAHALKSSSANVGASMLAALCLQLESAAKATDTSLISSLLDRLQQIFEHVAVEIGQLPEMKSPG